jgi:hypothetical protein
MGGLYNVGAGVYWSVALAGVYVAIRVNNNVVLGHDAGHLADRRYLGAQPVLLQEGDVIDVVLWNLSDGDVQVTSYPGDGLASPPLPYLTVWRV